MLCIPRVVAAQVPAPDQHQVALRQLVDARREAVEVGDEHRCGQLDAARRGAQDLGQARFEGPVVDAVRLVEQQVERRPARVRAEAVAERPGAQHQVEHPLGPAPAAGRQLGHQLVGVAPVHG
jgi:hypothetical protein